MDVRFPVEIVARHDINDLVHGVIVDENTGQDGLLRLDILRGDLERS